MSQKIDEFKEFVKANPSIKMIMEKKGKSWQDLFEAWSILGEDEALAEYSEVGDSGMNKRTTKSTIPVTKEMAQLGDMIKTCVTYVKKINPDSIAKTVTNVQKLMALVAGIGAANTVKAAKGNKMTGDPLFDKKFDDWY